MSKVTIDISTCVGCGLCEQSCPDVFEIQGDGVALVHNVKNHTRSVEQPAAHQPAHAPVRHGAHQRPKGDGYKPAHHQVYHQLRHAAALAMDRVQHYAEYGQNPDNYE